MRIRVILLLVSVLSIAKSIPSRYVYGAQQDASTVGVATLFNDPERYRLSVSIAQSGTDEAAARGATLGLSVGLHDSLDKVAASDNAQAVREVDATQITCLYLSGTSLSDEDWKRLLKLSKLRAIRIDICDLADRDLLMLSRFNELTDIRITGT